MSEYKVTQKGQSCDVYQELDRLERFGLIEKIVSRETKVVKTKNPDIKVAMDYYHERFLDKFKEKPDIKGAKDGAILTRVVGKYGIEKTKHMIDIFLASDDPFIEKSGRTLGVFSSVINKLLLNNIPTTKTGKALKAIADWSNGYDQKTQGIIDVDIAPKQLEDPKKVKEYLFEFSEGFGNNPHT